MKDLTNTDIPSDSKISISDKNKETEFLNKTEINKIDPIKEEIVIQKEKEKEQVREKKEQDVNSNNVISHKGNVNNQNENKNPSNKLINDTNTNNAAQS